jgi:hypothetical protein
LLDQIGTAGFIAKVHIPAVLWISIRRQPRAEPRVALFRGIESIMPASQPAARLPADRASPFDPDLNSDSDHALLVSYIQVVSSGLELSGGRASAERHRCATM